MRALLRLFVVAVVLFPLTARAIDVWGDQWGTWTRENSPYNVVGPIRVPPESTLVIEPGVVVNLQGHYKFKVDSSATLLAVGTETDSIYFTTADTATGWGGIRFLGASRNSRISYCRLEYGKAAGMWLHPETEGGAIYCHYSSPIISDNNIINNSAGGIYCYHSSPEIRNNTIEDNSAGGGGGIACLNDSNPTISGNTISGNFAHFYGGGIYCRRSSAPLIIDNIISVNAAGNGGGIYCEYYSHPLIVNNTISGNSAVGWGGGICCVASSSPTIANTILWGDTAPNSPELWLGSSRATVAYCDVQGGWEGLGNIDADPLFVDPQNGDFHLQPNSPCIDTGDPQSGDPDHSRSDMGALPYFFEVAVRIKPDDPLPLSLPPGYDAYGERTIANNTTISQPFKLVTVITDSLGDTLKYISSREGELPGGFLGESYGYIHIPDNAPYGFYNYVLVASNPETREIWHTSVTSFEVSRHQVKLASVEGVSLTSPEITFGSRCYPNPFNISTTISYQLPVDSYVKLEVYNLLGRKVATLVDSKQEAGYRSVAWDASQVSSGLYFYKLTAGDFTETRRMMLVK